MTSLAPSLARCREEANRLAPLRSKASDGWLGDAAHAARASDHNPGARDLVHALDLTYDREHFDVHAYLERLRVGQDRRVKYLISNRRIAGASTKGGWRWQIYTGANPHEAHGHISIWSTVAAETDTRPWWPKTTTPEPTTPKEAMARVPNAVSAVRSHTGGVWVLARDGAVYAFGDAVYIDGYNAHPEWGGAVREFISIERNDAGGYDTIADDGAIYSFNPTG